jgi:hypothetical protein
MEEGENVEKEHLRARLACPHQDEDQPTLTGLLLEEE